MRSGFIPLHSTHKVLEIKSLFMYFVYILILNFQLQLKTSLQGNFTCYSKLHFCVSKNFTAKCFILNFQLQLKTSLRSNFTCHSKLHFCVSKNFTAKGIYENYKKSSLKRAWLLLRIDCVRILESYCELCFYRSKCFCTRWSGGIELHYLQLCSSL